MHWQWALAMGIAVAPPPASTRHKNTLERLTVARCPQSLQQPVDEDAHLGVALAAGQVERIQVGVTHLWGALCQQGQLRFVS